jgi:hypothetical protein
MNKDSVFSHGYNADATPKTREFTKDDYREVLRHLHILEAVRDGAVIFADEGNGDIPADLIPIDFSGTDIDQEISDIHARLRREWCRDEITSWIFNSSNYPSDLTAMTAKENYHSLSDALEVNKVTDPQVAKDLAATALTPLRKEAQNIAIQAQRDETIARRELSEETLGPLI